MPSPAPCLQPLRLTFVRHLPLHRGGKGWREVAHSAPLCREARGGRRSLALLHFAGRQGVVGGRSLCSTLPAGKARGRRGPEYRRKHPLRARTGGSGGHFALGVMAPRRPFCPLSAGGKWTNAPQRSAAGAPVDLTASVAAHSGFLRHDGGTRRRSPLCGQTAQARRGPRARRRRSLSGKGLYSGFAEILAYRRGYWPGVWPVLRMRRT